MKGFLLGLGRPSGPTELEDPLAKAEKFAGVRAVASAGGGRPVRRAMAVRIQRRSVKMPRTEPSVWRRVPNCSATDTMAKKEEWVAMYVLSSICANPPKAPTMDSIIWKVVCVDWLKV